LNVNTLNGAQEKKRSVKNGAFGAVMRQPSSNHRASSALTVMIACNVASLSSDLGIEASFGRSAASGYVP